MVFGVLCEARDGSVSFSVCPLLGLFARMVLGTEKARSYNRLHNTHPLLGTALSVTLQGVIAWESHKKVNR